MMHPCTSAIHIITKSRACHKQRPHTAEYQTNRVADTSKLTCRHSWQVRVRAQYSSVACSTSHSNTSYSSTSRNSTVHSSASYIAAVLNSRSSTSDSSTSHTAALAEHRMQALRRGADQLLLAGPSEAQALQDDLRLICQAGAIGLGLSLAVVSYLPALHHYRTSCTGSWHRKHTLAER